MSAEQRLVYLPLGGAGEIGMNCYLYGWGKPGEERWIMADCGVTFPDMDSSPGVELILPDTAYIEAQLDRLEGIFITHAHEDHIGALPHLWSRIGGKPIHARLFTARVARAKLEAADIDPEHVCVAPVWPKTVKAGVFSIGFMPISHSIPEASALIIDTPAGRVLHTGDFKLDRTPQLGEPWDPDMVREVAGDGLLALVCDSTNVTSSSPGRSEASITGDIFDLFKDWNGAIVATTFASNIARLRTLALAAKEAGRAIVVMGRAMHRMIGYGRETGILTDFPDTLGPEDVGSIPREHLFILATGSQGELRGASASLARGKHLGMELHDGDLFVFSSKTIPGNEKSVARIVNQLVGRGIRVIEGDARYHVSGHANRPDLQTVHDLTNPDLVIPMHGEMRHLVEHARMARDAGRKAAVAPNGEMVVVSGSEAGKTSPEAEAGRVYLDGTRLIGAMDGIVRARIRVALRGHVSVSVVIDEEGRPLDGAWAEPLGLPENGHGDLAEKIEDAVSTAMQRSKRSEIASDTSLEELITRQVGSICQQEVGKKPIVTVMINRLE